MIDGIDALARPGEVRRRIGVTGQYAGLDDFLSDIERTSSWSAGWLGCAPWPGAGPATSSTASSCMPSLLAGIGELSGGSRRRVDLAASLVGSPTVLFLDEPDSGLIHHTFVQPFAGPPQWQAPDGSAVSGTVVDRNANGAGNIAELNLDVTQIGTSTGLLAHVGRGLRLNPVGGVGHRNLRPAGHPDRQRPLPGRYVFIHGQRHRTASNPT